MSLLRFKFHSNMIAQLEKNPLFVLPQVLKMNKTPTKHRDISALFFLFCFFSANCIVPHTTELGMKDLTIHYSILDYFSYLTIYGDSGDLA